MSLRAMRVRQVSDLRAKGWSQSSIALRLGLSRTYINDLVRDPDGSLVRQRKARQGGTCTICGGPTTYATGGPPKRCRSCVRGRRC